MIIHYMQVAFRNLLKYKTQSVISILGLAVGFTCFALSTIWIHYEMTYDTFHEDAEKIHWMVRKSRKNYPFPLGKELKENYDEVEDYATFVTGDARLLHQTKKSDVKLMVADTSFLNMMNIRTLEGNSNFLIHGGTEVAITENKAQELFGEPVGKGNGTGQQQVYHLCGGQRMGQALQPLL